MSFDNTYRDFDLPTNATVNGHPIAHEGNHNDRGFPHQQYIDKTFKHGFYSTKSSGTSYAGKYIKIANVKYTTNGNVNLFYRFKFVELNYNAEHYLDVKLVSNTANVKLYHQGDGNITFYGIQSTQVVGSDTIYTIDIYAKPNVMWLYYFFRLEIARCSEYYGYDSQYAYRKITMYCGTMLYDDIPNAYVTSISPNVYETAKYTPATTLAIRQNYNKTNVANPSATADTFGTPVTSTPPPGFSGIFPQAIDILFGGTFGTETVTAQIIVNYADTTSYTFTKTATVAGNVSLINSEMMSLIKDGTYITQFTFKSKSSIASSAATVTFNRFGLYL